MPLPGLAGRHTLRIVTLILRTLFGLLFTIVGLNGVLLVTGLLGRGGPVEP